MSTCYKSAYYECVTVVGEGGCYTRPTGWWSSTYSCD